MSLYQTGVQDAPLPGVLSAWAHCKPFGPPVHLFLSPHGNGVGQKKGGGTPAVLPPFRLQAYRHALRCLVLQAVVPGLNLPGAQRVAADDDPVDHAVPAEIAVSGVVLLGKLRPYDEAAGPLSGPPRPSRAWKRSNDFVNIFQRHETSIRRARTTMIVLCVFMASSVATSGFRVDHPLSTRGAARAISEYHE